MTASMSTTLTELDPWHIESLLLDRVIFFDLRVSSFVHWRQLYSASTGSRRNEKRWMILNVSTVDHVMAKFG